MLRSTRVLLIVSRLGPFLGVLMSGGIDLPATTRQAIIYAMASRRMNGDGKSDYVELRVFGQIIVPTPARRFRSPHTLTQAIRKT